MTKCVRKNRLICTAIVVVVIASAFIVGLYIGRAAAQTAVQEIYMPSQNFTEPNGYIVFKVSNVTYVKNGLTGTVEFSSADDTEAIMYAINAIDGGSVFIKYAKYVLKSTLKPKSSTAIVSDGATLIFDGVDRAILLEDVYGVRIENLNLVGNWNSQKAIVVEDCDGGHNVIRNIWIDQFFTAIRLEAINKIVSHNVFEDIYVFNGQYGIVAYGSMPDVKVVTLNTFRKFVWRGLVNNVSIGIDLQKYVDNNYFEDVHLTLLYSGSIGIRLDAVLVYDNVFVNPVIDQFALGTVSIKDESNEVNWFIRPKLGGGYQTPPQTANARFLLGTLAGDRLVGNSGIATISSGSKHVTVIHGLASAPRIILITPLGQPPGRIWAENITSTSFEIVIDTAPTSDLKIAWYAET